MNISSDARAKTPALTETLTEKVLGIMRREWRCVFDGALLEGMVYQSVLGNYASRTLTVRECRERARELGLPTRFEIEEAAREAVRLWGEG